MRPSVLWVICASAGCSFKGSLTNMAMQCCSAADRLPYAEYRQVCRFEAYRLLSLTKAGPSALIYACLCRRGARREWALLPGAAPPRGQGAARAGVRQRRRRAAGAAAPGQGRLRALACLRAGGPQHALVRPSWLGLCGCQRSCAGARMAVPWSVLERYVSCN